MENFHQTIETYERDLDLGIINEWEYLRLMNMAKDRFNKANSIEDDDDDYIEVEEVEVRHPLNLVKAIEGDNWYIFNSITEDTDVFDNETSAREHWNR